MQKLIKLFKSGWEEWALLFLLAFIPLYPKLPLFDVVQTWVYIRLDDFLVALIITLFAIKLYRKKRIPSSPLTYPIILYWIVGAISTAYSLAFIGPKLIGYFPQLVFLHYLRRIEYMSVFFLAVIVTNSQDRIKRFLLVFIFSVLAVSLYGIGQRYMHFPAFLTMNEEFAKGVPLYLAPTSRITSTFAGHYDLAIYLAFAITLFTSIFFSVKSILYRLGIFTVGLLGTAVLLMTQSRVSLFALGIGIFCVLWWHNRKRWIIPAIILGILSIPFVPGVADRFAKTFRDHPVVYDIRAGIPIGAASVTDDGQVLIVNSASPALENLPIGSGFIRVPFAPPTPILASFAVGELRKLPGYPYGAQKPSLGEELHMATERNAMYLSVSNTLATSTEEVASVSGRFYLDRALLYDISFTTRYQGTWPRAWEAFNRNYFLGSGYSVLSIASDSDYMRALGETGILGLASFLLILIVFILYVRHSIGSATPIIRSLALGATAGLIGLLITASLIDVFEASKVAYTIWLTFGVVIGALSLGYKKQFPLIYEIRRVALHPIVFIALLGFMVPMIYRGVTSIYFVADDFTWLRWASQSSPSGLGNYFTDASGFFYRPLTKLYFFIASLVFWQKSAGYHTVNLFFHFGAIGLTYLIARKLTKHTGIAILAALYFLVLALHHENVIWISGVSSLAGGFFALSGVFFWISGNRSFRGIASILFSIISVILSMFWYEEMIFIPLVHVVYAWMYWPKKYKVFALPLALLIPMYWWIRMYAHALVPTGSYGINFRLLPLNMVGNIVGYLSLIFGGTSVIPGYDYMRAALRASPFFVFALVILICISGWLLIQKIKKRISLSKTPMFLILFSLLAMAPSLGLGNIAERYGYLASSSISILFVYTLYKFSSRAKYIALILYIISFGLNYLQLRGHVQEWQIAGKQSERMLYEMRRMYFPIDADTQFVVAQVPTRIGRAWIFPVGLTDAAYLTFRNETMKLDVVGSQLDALQVKARNPDTIKALTITDDIEYPIQEVYE